MTSWLLLVSLIFKDSGGIGTQCDPGGCGWHRSLQHHWETGRWGVPTDKGTAHRQKCNKEGPFGILLPFFLVLSHSGHMVCCHRFAVHHERMMFQIFFPFVASLEDDGKELRSWSLIRCPMRTYLCTNIHLWTESLCTDSRQLCMMVNVEFPSIWTDLQLAGMFCSYTSSYCVITYICSL